MTITISDLRRAILNSGDISAFAEVYRQALDQPPVNIISAFESPIALPEPTTLLKHLDKQLSAAVAHFHKEQESCQPTLTEIDLKLVALSRYGNNAGKYLERIIEETKPDIIAVDTCSIEFGAYTRYACSLPCAVGLPAQVQITKKYAGRTYARRVFYPSSTIVTAIIKSWLHKIPIVPIGHPLKPIQLETDPWGGAFDADYTDRNKWESAQYVAYSTFEHGVKADTDLRDGNNLAREAGLKLMTALNAEQRNSVIEEAAYASSRILDIASYARLLGRKIRLLALVDITHYVDVADVTAEMYQGTMNAVHAPRKIETIDEMIVMEGKVLDNLNGTGGGDIHDKALAEELFHNHLARFIQAKDSRIIPEAVVYGLLAKIAERIRTHPDIARGLSVRGTIAFKEILGGLSLLNGNLTQAHLMKAALITLPPRIFLKRKGNEAAIVTDIVKEILYHFDFHGRGNGKESQSHRALSTADIVAALNQLSSLPLEQSQNIRQEKSPAVVPEAQGNREAIKYLEEMDYVRIDAQGQSVFTAKGIELLMNSLEEKLESGKISLEEYHQQKSWLMQQMKNITQARPSMPKGEIANTIMEMIDAQDKQWNSGVDFSTMHVYYHIKANRERDRLNPQKCDYYALKRVIDDLLRQKILAATDEPSTFHLTGLALNILLSYLLGKNTRGKKAQAVTDYGKTRNNERSQDIRKFSSGDSYRNISIRRTLKEIARQRKSLSHVRNGDFRVFLTQSRKNQSDIIVCLDTSGSMGFHQKLMYARLVAAGIVQTALKEGNRIGIVAFNDYGQVAMPLTESDEDSLINFIAKVNPRGNTNIGEGIKFSMEALFQNHNRNQKHIIVISDGLASAISESTLSQLKEIKGRDLTEESALHETKKAAASGIQLSVIHIAGKGEVSSNFMNTMARVGNGRVYRISDSAALRALLC